jgi:hypothetical protein
MGHGAAVDPGDEAHQCGTVAPFFNAAGISSSYRIASFWGLAEARQDVAIAAGTPHDATADSTSTADAQAAGKTTAEEPSDAGTREAAAGAPGIDIEGIIAKSLEMAGLLRARPGGPSARTQGSAAPFGVDVQKIIATSLEAAGLLKGGSRESSRNASAAPFGVDVPGIVATALQAAGVLDGSRKAGTGGGEGSLAGSGWEGAGWELLHDKARAFRGGPMLHARVVSGDAASVGRRVRSASRRMTLGANPELSYVRKIDLAATANPYAAASFRILVEGVPVDEASALGMNYAETEWTRRTGIDLRQFADRTVTVTLEVAATANARSEVCAEVWLDEVTVGNATAVEPA